MKVRWVGWSLALLMICQNSYAASCKKLFLDYEITHNFVEVLDGQYEMAFDKKVRKNSTNKVVYLDGMGLSFRHSQAMAQSLRAMGVELVRLDMLGISNTLKRSIDKAGGNYKLPEIPVEMQAQAVIDAITALSNKKVILVGESYGGAVAATVAKMRPDLIEQLNLIGPHVKDLIYTNPMTSSVAAFSEGLASLNPAWGLFVNMGRRSALNQGFAHLVPGPLKNHQDLYMEAVNTLSDGVRYFDMKETLSGIEVPTSIIFGEKDSVIPGRFFEEAFAQVPKENQRELVEIKDGIHDLTTQIPEYLAQWIRDHIN